MTPEQTRQNIVDYVRRELVGPRGGGQEVLDDEPHKRYTAGTLYPQDTSLGQTINDDEEDEDGIANGSDQENQADDPIVLANQQSPASMGLSFYIAGSKALAVVVSGAHYKETTATRENGPAGKGKSWQHIPLEATFDVLEPPKGQSELDSDLFEGKARLNVVWRQGHSGWLVTVTLINKQTLEPDRGPSADRCLFQVEVRCRAAKGGVITQYPRARLLTDDPEEHILDLLYRHQVAYGAGHGCSVMWTPPENGTTTEIWTDVLPTQKVPSITYELSGHDNVLDLYFLGYEEGGSHKQVISGLEKFVNGYETWVKEQPEKNSDVPADLAEAQAELMDRMRVAVGRLRKGVDLLREDAIVFEAFRLANRAMFMQMDHGNPAYQGSESERRDRTYKEPIAPSAKRRTWRPFQLAFQLLTLTSLTQADDPERQLVDLIWFPTGGGKTEAYLAASAILIFYRRLAHPNMAGGTAIIMRYTLRLLTTQQFRRAAILICACEAIRRANPGQYGKSEISIGLWVGVATTPNSYKNAFEKYIDVLGEVKPRTPFQIERCPWCGMPMVPEKIATDRGLYGIRATNSMFELFCPDATCPFHDRLPIGVVDDQLYNAPPTLLIGTVDKFARMPWEGRVASFFGNGQNLLPELIIQDELHLISGPLGTIVGLYETAIDALATYKGMPPKIIASTATIRRADEQCLGLYARKVQLFPPAGLDARDSYFARYHESGPGRLYVGVMGPAHTASTTMIRTSAALLQAPIELGLTGDALDAYWTLVGYHNSLRELGKSLTFASDDIPARIKVIATDQADLRDLSHNNIAELTSNIDAPDLAGMLARLEQRVNETDAVSFLVCTNMLSVGVDVSRLGLMLVNGQPKSTSEYIQATSRVGRKELQAPGLVVCVYAASKPRDRSHYERFVAYHQALYRYVEPTSVTPFARPARDRALHAVLVSLVRLGLGLTHENDAARFRMDSQGVTEITQLIINRVKDIDVREAEATAQQLQNLVEEWHALAENDSSLEYHSQHKGKTVLLKHAGSSDIESDAWETLNSMRNVDRSCNVRIIS